MESLGSKGFFVFHWSWLDLGVHACGECFGMCAFNTPSSACKPIKGACDLSIVEHILMTICAGAVMIGGVAFPSEQAEQQDGHRHDVQDE